MTTNAPTTITKRLNEWSYVTYKRYVEHQFQSKLISKDVIARAHVETDKKLFANALFEPTDETDHIIGTQLYGKALVTPSDGEYIKANAWGKCAKRMALVIKQLYPTMFFDSNL